MKLTLTQGEASLIVRLLSHRAHAVRIMKTTRETANHPTYGLGEELETIINLEDRILAAKEATK